MIFYHILSLLITNSILILWFFSPLSSSIGKFFFKKDNIYMLDDLLDIIALKSNFLSTLLSCWICLSFWTSLIISSIICLFFSLPYYFPIVAFFTYPSILFLIKQLYR
jgi:hypothetical protein